VDIDLWCLAFDETGVVGVYMCSRADEDKGLIARGVLQSCLLQQALCVCE
jgi:hypothetical protein